MLVPEMQLCPSAPIGIFDSGVGGLTVAMAINLLLPHEKLIYFGDTYHAPWGDKSEAVIEHYAVKICDFLLERGCKAIVIACNTASAVALAAIKHQVAGRAHVINVIDPTVKYIQHHLVDRRIGLIGTKQTVASASYARKLADSANMTLHSLATPLLVSLIEEGFSHKLACELILAEYLSHPTLADIDALILGCTHYPLLKPQIASFYRQHVQHTVQLIDAADFTAAYVKQELGAYGLLHAGTVLQDKAKPAVLVEDADKQFFISDYNPHFLKIAQQFFPTCDLIHHDLWSDV